MSRLSCNRIAIPTIGNLAYSVIGQVVDDEMIAPAQSAVVEEVILRIQMELDFDYPFEDLCSTRREPDTARR